MKYDSLSDTQKNVGKQETWRLINIDKASENVYQKEIWNAAIEAAASIAPYYTAQKIRKLKK